MNSSGNASCPRVLLTGGLGYIGSHTAVMLLGAGWDVTVLDNLSNSSRDVAWRIEKIAGRPVDLVEADVRDAAAVSRALSASGCVAVVHFAGAKSVGESVADPLAYFDNNVSGSLALLRAMRDSNVRRLVFSSSATVYGTPNYLPVDEAHPTSAMNPYGRTKLHVEEILHDLAHADPDWRIVCLRYFNPCGAHASGLIGEDPRETPNNLMPYVARVASRELQRVQVFGNDYDTPDGTGVRDFLHVDDLAVGHLRALEYCDTHRGWDAINLGTGRGYSVLEMIRAFEKASGREIPYVIAPRREGDVAACWADASKAERLLGWKATLGIEDMCRSAWAWQQNARARTGSD